MLGKAKNYGENCCPLQTTFSHCTTSFPIKILWLMLAKIILKHIISLFQDFIEHGRSHDHFRHAVRITVRCGSSILQVSLAFLSNMPWNSNTGATVSNSCWKIVNATCLVMTCQPPLVVFTIFWIISANVCFVIFSKLLDCIFDYPKRILGRIKPSLNECGSFTFQSSALKMRNLPTLEQCNLANP